MRFLFCFSFLFLFSFQTFAQKEDWLIPYRKDTLWGYCDVNGKIKIKPQYFEAKPFNTYLVFDEELAIVCFNFDEDSCALINTKGQIITTNLNYIYYLGKATKIKKSFVEETFFLELAWARNESSHYYPPYILRLRQLTPYLRSFEFTEKAECFGYLAYASILTDNNGKTIIPYTEGQIHVFKGENCILLKKRGDKILLNDKGGILTHFVGVTGLTRDQCFSFGFMFFNNYPRKAKSSFDYIGYNGVKYFEDSY